MAAVERLLDRQRNMSSFGYGDGFITVSIEEVAGALAEGAAEWDAQQVGVIPPDEDTVCPECQQGKHDNCTELVLTEGVVGDDGSDIWVECRCAAQGHGE